MTKNYVSVSISNSYCLSTDETVAYLERLLRRYEGTHNYHNFTSGKKYEDMSSKRYITSFRVSSECTCLRQCDHCSINLRDFIFEADLV